MLRSIGKSSKSILLKIFVGIIILPFIFWGMGDVFKGGNKNIVATVDNSKIGSEEFMFYLESLNLSDQDKKNIKSTNLIENILSEFIGKKIMQLEMKKLGILISDKSLKDMIINDKTFHKDGKFSRLRYEEFLIKSSIDAPSFERNFIEQEKKRQFLNFLSSGIKIPKAFIQSEYNKENQIKDIEYIDLNDFINKKKINDKEIKIFYDKNKETFKEEIKDIKYVELKPEILSSQKKFDEEYFKNLDKIENDILDGKKLNEISDFYKLEAETISEVKINKENLKGQKFSNIKDPLFQKMFRIKEINQPNLLNFENKFYISEISSKKESQLTLSNKNLFDNIKNQLNFREKIKVLKDISNKIENGNYNKEQMKKFAAENSVIIKNINIKNLKNDTFDEKVSIKIFNLKDGQVKLISDRVLSKNYIVHSKKTKFKELKRNSKDYEKYKKNAKLSFSKEIFGVYDTGLNFKYNVEFNAKTIDRIKKTF